MARYDSKVLKLSKVSKESPYCFRYRLRDEGLKTSVKRSGILMPVIVTNAERPVVIAGHKRFFAAQALKMREIPVLIAEKIKPKEAFLLNLVSNWKQGCSEMDRARAFGLAVRAFHFNEQEILSGVMPLLGLSGDGVTRELYRKADLFSPSFKDFVEDGQLALRWILPFLKFSGNDQDYFVENIGARVKLTSSQLFQVSEWLSDIMRGTGKCLREVCQEHRVLAKLGTRGMDLRMKADRFFARVKRLRFPGYAGCLDTFEERRADILHDAPGLRLEPIQGFEEPGFELHARVKTLGELDRLLQKLSLKRSLLNSLFEIA